MLWSELTHPPIDDRVKDYDLTASPFTAQRLVEQQSARMKEHYKDPENYAQPLLPTHLKPLILFRYYCDVRVGEALQIEWPQVDSDAGLIRLEEEQTKTDEARYAPLPAELIMLLREINPKVPKVPKVGKVFDDSNLRVEWQKACAACGQGTRNAGEAEG